MPHHLKRSILLLGILVLPSVFFPPRVLGTSNSVESSERLALLNQATGASSGNTSTYENRLDAILSTERSVERSYVVAEESSAREKASVALQQEETEILRAKELSPERYSPKKSKDNTQIADSNSSKNSKYDGTEKAYQTAKENIQKEFDEKLKKESLQASKRKTAAIANESQNSLSPSLANNPFYVGEEKDPEQKKFDSRRAVIVSRLVERGVLDPEAANAAVGGATSEDDLVINLMKDYSLSYGDATDVAS